MRSASKEKIAAYQQDILNRLGGKTDDLKDVPKDRLDWSGVGSVLALYESTSGKDRNLIIRAFGSIIRTADRYPVEATEVLDLVIDLDLSQLHPLVERLRVKRINYVPLKDAVSDYFAFRQLAERTPQQINS